VGDWVIAIGNPFGLGGTVTQGIISAVYRATGSGSAYDRYLQTDASINRGNSGGPMFDMAGNVIGINNAIYSPTGGSVGIGFAIPAEIAAPIVEKLKNGQAIERGYLGVRIQPINDDLAASLGLPKNRANSSSRSNPARARPRPASRPATWSPASMARKSSPTRRSRSSSPTPPRARPWPSTWCATASR
jgi:S1-C subfamily serine protease